MMIVESTRSRGASPTATAASDPSQGGRLSMAYRQTRRKSSIQAMTSPALPTMM
jgi:hypothetical protein